MADEAQELRATLARLHEQLRGAANLSPETRDLLQGVAQDIDSLLTEGGTANATTVPRAGQHDEPESIIGRLASAEREFEATHPTLSGIVGSLIDALGRMGI